MNGLYHLFLDLDLELLTIGFFFAVCIAWAAMVVFWPAEIDRWLD